MLQVFSKDLVTNGKAGGVDGWCETKLEDRKGSIESISIEYLKKKIELGRWQNE